MKVKKSVCTNLVFPKSRKDMEEFRHAAQVLSAHQVDSMEFYHDGADRGRTGRILEEYGLEGIYIAVIPSKEQKLHACSMDEENRKAAVKLFHSCMEEAADNGISILMMNSGEIGPSVQGGLAALRETVRDLYEYRDKKGFPMRITLEPCDSWMHARQLLGPSERTAGFLKSLRQEGIPLELTMDSAHTLEEGEDFVEALKRTKPYCSHIHFANCYIRDAGSGLYGDQHLGFEYPDTECDFSAIQRMWPQIQELYGEEELRVAIEVLCREEEPDAYFAGMWSRMPYVN